MTEMKSRRIRNSMFSAKQKGGRFEKTVESSAISKWDKLVIFFSDWVRRKNSDL
jgi:hypothetical protein